MEKVVFNNYKVNKNGEVFSEKLKRKMKTSINHKGYEQIYLVVDGKKRTTFVHRLVAIAFLPNPLNLKQVNHKDGNKLNNNVNNLEWCTDAQNHEHAFKNNLQIRKKIIMKDLQDDKTMYFDSIQACARYLNTSQYNVSRVCSKIRKTLFKRYVFEYAS